MCSIAPEIYPMQVEILTQRSLFLEAELEKKSRQLQEKTEEARMEIDKNNAAKEVIKSLITQVDFFV